ncbi:choice-of-anchor A family protein, partial [Candidatus Albibeggiatoa sp. nov. NOAA]|uniref:choice-of-anchor A family protein n=1 Tax=Candidatus Albibeggiatoa sp. nov. NOAA TaxID=3162724 RepID=UPI0032FDE971|nr:choice-of-anchor A family protein [Thiotrichaceae bacterium]
MRMKHFLLAVPLLLGSWQPVLADTNPFGTASDYNKFILGDMTHYGGDSEGAVAIAGDAELVNYGIADRTPNVINGLVVGGSLTQSNGQTFAGDVHVAGSVNNISTILSGSLQNPSSPIDFNQEATSLRALSTFWQQLPTNGALNLQGWGGLELTGTDNDLNVFSITEAQWKGTRQINLSVPASSSVIINVEGTADSIPSDHSWFGAMFFNNSTDAADWQKVIWNFPNMTTFSIQNIGWKGTLFAPNAYFTYASGNVEGHLIVNSVSALQNSAETHWYPFTGDVPVPEATDDSNDDANAGADDNSDNVDNSGNAGACNIAGGDAVTLSAGGPGAKETDYTITFEGAAGDTWTYS